MVLKWLSKHAIYAIAIASFIVLVVGDPEKPISSIAFALLAILPLLIFASNVKEFATSTKQGGREILTLLLRAISMKFLIVGTLLFGFNKGILLSLRFKSVLKNQLLDFTHLSPIALFAISTLVSLASHQVARASKQKHK